MQRSLAGVLAPDMATDLSNIANYSIAVIVLCFSTYNPTDAVVGLGVVKLMMMARYIMWDG